MNSKDAMEQFKKGLISADSLKKICSENATKAGLVKTKSFGWVLREDLEKYDFLKRDNGIPVGGAKIPTTVEEEYTDTHGNKRKRKVSKNIVVQSVSQEYLDWCELKKKRQGANYYKEKSFQSLIDDENIPFEANQMP